MATQLQAIGGLASALTPTASAQGEQPDFASFSQIPSGHGVAVMAGHVVVYDEHDLHQNDLQTDAFYVIEYQRTRACMSWSMFHDHELRRLDTAREVVRVFQRPSHPDHWWFQHCRSMWIDGPMLDFNLTDMIVGRVVGIYRPD